MKTTFQIEIVPGSVSTFFPKYRVKDKFTILEILLESVRYMIHGKREKKSHSDYKIVFFKSKMCRVFFVSPNKIYSIRFPFNVIISGDNIHFTFQDQLEIESLTISNLIKLLKSYQLSSENCLDFIEPILEVEDEYKVNLWPLFKELLLQEDGYIRYDIDETAFLSAKSKNEEHLHPLHHLDVFYTSSVSFKIGLEKPIVHDDFIDTLNIETNCKYMKN